MPVTTLRTVGGSVMMTIPKKMLELMHLHPGYEVNIDIQGGKLVIEPRRKPHYTLAELMAQCDLSHPLDTEEQQWLDSPHIGNEEL